MRVNSIFLSILMSLALLLTACATEKKADVNTAQTTIAPTAKAESEAQNALKRQDEYKKSENAAKVNVSSYQTVTETYTFNDARNDFAIRYPQITNLGDDERQRKINELIEQGAIPRYFFDRPADDGRMFTLPIDYKITWQSDRLLSIQYSGVGYVKGTPHPNHFFYTTNIDIVKGTKLVLKDLVRIDETLVEKFRGENIKTVSPHPSALSGKEIFIDRTPFGTVQDTVNEFLRADIVTAKGGLPGVYSYFTAGSLGISTGTSHAIGDHAEFEIKYGDIAKHIRAENEVWKDFFSGVGK